jgi:hypothetical protein
MHKNIIYALVDPRTNEIRYIGQSSRGFKRPVHHWDKTALRRDSHLHSTRWIMQLIAEGKLPLIEVLEEVDACELNASEILWIARGRAFGWPLTNLTDGGGGILGFRDSPKSRSLKSKRALEVNSNPEVIKRKSAAQQINMKRPEVLARISAGNLGKRRTPEQKAKISAAVKAAYARDPTIMQRVADKKRGVLASPETRAKMTASQLARWAAKKASM